MPPVDHKGETPEISPQIVRAIAQAGGELNDYRERFPESQPELWDFIAEQLEEAGDLAISFARGIAAALWAMYEADLGSAPPLISEQSLGRFLPLTRELLETLIARHHVGEEFDAEWLAELPRGAQPHVMGFLIGALRAARFNLSGPEIFDTAAVLFSAAGALEGAASLARAARN